MKKIVIAALFMAIFAAASVSGCTFPSGGETSPTPTVIYGPVPSPLPTPTPVPETGSAQPRSITSPDLDLTFSPIHYKIMSYQRTQDGKQFENVSMIISNNGDSPAKNVVLKLILIDDSTMENLLYQEFSIGDLNKGERKQVYLLTRQHNPSYLVKMSIEIDWGNNGEYYNPVIFPSGADSIFTLPV